MRCEGSARAAGVNIRVSKVLKLNPKTIDWARFDHQSTTLLPTVISLAIRSMLKPKASGNKPCVTISLDIKFIAPSNLGDELLGTVEIQKVTKSMVFVNCKLKCKNKLVASAVGIWKILRRPLPNAGLGG